MKLPGALVLAALGLASLSPSRAADPAKVDHSARNAPFAPAPTVAPAKRSPEINRTLQDSRVNPAVTTPEAAPASERRAPTAVGETREKNLITPDSHRPETVPVERNAFDQRRSRFQPAADARQPQLVERYRTTISAETMSHQGRLAAGDVGATARINRFVFRRNQATPQGTSAAIPAGGRATGSTPSRAP